MILKLKKPMLNQEQRYPETSGDYLMTGPEADTYLGRSKGSLCRQRAQAKAAGIPPLIPFIQPEVDKVVWYWKSDLDKALSGKLTRRGPLYAKEYCTPEEAAGILGVPVSALAKDRKAFNEAVPFTLFSKKGPMYRRAILDAIKADPGKVLTVRRKLTGFPK